MLNNIIVVTCLRLDENKADTKDEKMKNTVMVCEDDPAILKLIQQILGSKYSTIVVDSGTECLSKYIDEKAKGNQIDVLVVDYGLPDLPGDIIASTVRELGGNQKRITHTVLIGTEQVDKELIDELKGKEYIIEGIEKPLCPDTLLAIIEKAIA
jgi:CheY-like chemotaxis protein